MKNSRLMIAALLGIGMTGGLATFYWSGNDSGFSVLHSPSREEQGRAGNGESIPASEVPNGISVQLPLTRDDDNSSRTAREESKEKPTRDDVKKLLFEVDDMIKQFNAIPRCEIFASTLQSFYTNASMSLQWADEQLAAQYQVSRQQGDSMLPIHADYYAKAYGGLRESIESSQIKSKLDACRTGKYPTPG